MTNIIPQSQVSDKALQQLRARQAVYASATRIQVMQLLVTVVFPVVAAIVGLHFQAVRPYVAAASVAASLLDTAVFDRTQRRLLERAAKIAEQFDVEILQMPWNAFVAGKRIDPEIIHEAASRWVGVEKIAKLRDWYPAAVGCAPLPLARIICQRTNLWYDSNLRQAYGTLIVWFAVVVAAGLIVAALALDLRFLELVTTAIVPASPVLIWAIRERFRQKDTAEAQERLKAEAESFWDRAKEGVCGDDECAARSREFQNSIYARRASSPLILPFIYSLRRGRMEVGMKVGAEAMLAEAGIGTATSPADA
jgi:hypothetical protein